MRRPTGSDVIASPPASAAAPPAVVRAARRSSIAVAAALLLSSCAGSGGGPRPVTSSVPPPADSITLALFRFDDAGGTTTTDDGPSRLRGVAGVDTRTEFGRFGNARVFTRSHESWVYVPYATDLDTRHLTVEAWISPAELGLFEDTPIAGRWSDLLQNEQLWLFSLVGSQRESRLTSVAAPGYHETLVAGASPGRLMFAFQPAEALPVQVYYSTSDIPLLQWTHVAVSHDGELVRFFVNGRLDAQFATGTTLRTGPAPLVIGNAFDTRVLGTFTSDLRVGGRIRHAPVYAFVGSIDELRISSQARAGF
jgi:hypothetical protein